MRIRVLVCAFILALTISSAFGAQIFEGLPLPRRLARRSNNAIHHLRSALNDMFVCGGGCSCGAGWNRARFNSDGHNEQYDFTVPQLRCHHKHKSRYQLNVMARELRKKIERVADLLRHVRIAFADYYNNVVVGDGNNVSGDDNFVVGDYNEFSGDSNWVFSSNVNSRSSLDGVLIIDTFVIELEDLLATNRGIDNMIHCTGQSDSANRRKRWWKATDKHVKI